MDIPTARHEPQETVSKGLSSTITTKGQVTIPRSIREYLGVKPADTIEFTITAGAVVLHKPSRLSLDAVFGTVTPVSYPEDFKSRRDAAIEEHIEKGRALKA